MIIPYSASLAASVEILLQFKAMCLTMDCQKGEASRKVHEQIAFDFGLWKGKRKVNLMRLPFEKQRHDEAETN